MLKRQGNLNTVIWAIDPFEGKLKPHPFEVRSLQSWVNENGVQIQPVYMVDQNHLTVEKINSLEKAVENYLQDLGFKGNLKPEILMTADSSTEALTKRLTFYSKEIGANMIIVSSRGRKGFDRFILGSFAESLMLHSECPLYFLTHQNGTPTEQRMNKVLFSTDFSKHSEQAFDTLLEHVKFLNSEVIIYNAISLPSSSTIIPDDYCSMQEEEAKKLAEKFLEKTKPLGLKSKFVIEYVGAFPNIAPSIVDIAKRESVRFVGMASNSGRVGAIFFGSVAREVFRSNLFPVWICGPKAMN